MCHPPSTRASNRPPRRSARSRIPRMPDPVPGAAVTPEEVVAHVRGRLARYKCPKQVIVSAQLPRTASGKLQKNVLRERWLKERETAPAS